MKVMLTMNGRFIRDVFFMKIEDEKIFFKTSSYLEPVNFPLQISIKGINNIYLTSCYSDESDLGSYICEAFFD